MDVKRKSKMTISCGTFIGLSSIGLFQEQQRWSNKVKYGDFNFVSLALCTSHKILMMLLSFLTKNGYLTISKGSCHNVAVSDF